MQHAAPQHRRAAVYLRVSTGRQAEGQVSIPSQRKLIRQFCADHHWPVTREFVDAGASGRDDDRPQLQAMLEAARRPDRDFDVIVVHAFSRFFRDSVSMELTIRSLRKMGVEIVSITQPTGPDPSQQMVRQIISLFDEYQSHENAKNVSRAMAENARQGFHNGTTPPLGYVAVDAETRGAKVKRRLQIHPVEAETVKLIFELYVTGHASTATPPLGIKEVAKWLNRNGYRTKRGGSFGVGPVHAILTNTAYVGEAKYNVRDRKSGAKRPEHEIVRYKVPAIVDQNLFDKAQAKRIAHHPHVMAPRIAAPAMLLSGLAVCEHCGGGMTQRTGTSSSGRVYAYYCCAARAQKGPTACGGNTIRMGRLDDAVLEALRSQVLSRDRLKLLLAELLKRRNDRAAAVDARIQSLQDEVTNCDNRLSRLYQLIENGSVDIDDVLKQRLYLLKSQRVKARAALDHAQAAAAVSVDINEEKIDAFGSAMSELLSTPADARLKAYLRTLIDKVIVGPEKIRIVGNKEALAASVSGLGAGTNRVRGFVPEWRARKDSNL